MEELLISLLAGISLGLLCWSFYTIFKSTAEFADADIARENMPILFKLVLPLARGIGVSIASYIGRLEKKYPLNPPFLVSFKNRIERNLITAGNPFDLSPYYILGFMCVFAVIVGGLSFTLMNFTGQSLSLVTFVAIIMFIAGGIYPLLWLKDTMNRRVTSIRKTLPYALDLITLSVEAGLDFTSALSNIVKKLGDKPLANELGQTLREITMGKTRAEALHDLAYRINIPEMQSVTGAIIQADELGASLGPVLRVQAEQLRTKRFQRAEKMALEAPVKMLLPLVAFIFPTTFIIIFGPLILKYFIAR